MSPRSRPTPALLVAALLLTACADAPTGARSVAGDRAGWDQPGAHRQYGVPVTLGSGKVRTYVVVDQKSGAPLEIGVAMDAKLLEGTLPTDHAIQLPLQLPPLAPEPWDFVLFDWNPGGHPPPGVYTVPHFDFHFYRMEVEDVMAILPTSPDYVTSANDLPTGAEVPPWYILPAPPGVPPVALAEPQMGLHWVDVRAPEIQNLLGNPSGYAPFTRTFIYGSWAGEITFWEPMVTRAWLLSRTNETIAIPVPGAYPEPGWYPGAYTITYDAQQKEYRVAIVQLALRE